MLTNRLEKFNRRITIPHFTSHGQIFLRQFRHATLDGRQIFGGKRGLMGKVIIKPVFNHWTNGDLCVRKERLDGIRHQMRGGMTNDLQTLGILIGKDGQLRIPLDEERSIHQRTIHAPRQRGLSQAGGNGCRNVCNGHGLVERTFGTVGEANHKHGQCP